MKTTYFAILSLLIGALTFSGIPANAQALPAVATPVAPAPADSPTGLPSVPGPDPSPAETPGVSESATPVPTLAPTTKAPLQPSPEASAEPSADSAETARAAADPADDEGFVPVGAGHALPGPNTPLITAPDGSIQSAVESHEHDSEDAHGLRVAAPLSAPTRSGEIKVTLVTATLADDRRGVDVQAARNAISTSSSYWKTMSNNRLSMSVAATRQHTSAARSTDDFTVMMNTISREIGWRDSPYTALVVFVPAGELRSGGYGGILGGGWSANNTGGRILMPAPSPFSPNVVAHEFGHVLGLMHSNSLQCTNGRADVGINSSSRWADWACSSREYGDTLDLMGTGQYKLPVINSFFWDGGGFGRGNEVRDTGTVSGSRTYTLTAWAGTAANRAIKFKDPVSDEVYYLELRLPVGNDAAAAVGGNRGVKIVKSDLVSWGNASVLIPPSTRPFPGYYNTNHAWQAGQTFTTHGGTTVRINSIGSTSASVTVSGSADWSVKTLSPGDFNNDGKADLITRRSNGTLWFSPGTGKGTFGTARQIGSGFEIFDHFITTGDYDGDGRNDFLARHLDGSLWRYSGTGTVSATNEGYRPGSKIGTGGWDAFTDITGVRDANGDGRNDILARTSNGTALLYFGTGTGAHGTAKTIATGWNNYTSITGTADFNGDRRTDLLARTGDGRIWLLTGNGNGTFTNPTTIGTGWNTFTEILGGTDLNNDKKPDLLARTPTGGLTFYAGTGKITEGYKPGTRTNTAGLTNTSATLSVPDFDNDKKPDLLTVRTDGTLWFHRGTGNGTYQTPQRIGTGWNIYTEVTSPGDFNGDGKADLLARTSTGDLVFYAGTGKISTGNEGYAPGKTIGTGWNIYTQIIGTADLNKDNKPDLLARTPTGDLVFYAGTGKIGTGNEGYAPGKTIGRGGWNAFTELTAAADFDGNGTNDILARYPDGRLLLYPGTGTGTFHTGQTIGTGWNIYATVLGTGDVTGDKKPDYTAITPNGTSWHYAGDGKPSEGYTPGKPAGNL